MKIEILNVLSPAEFKKLMSACWRIWEGIAPDAMEAVPEASEGLDEPLSVGFVLDCSLLETEAERDNDAELTVIVAKFRALSYGQQEQVLIDHFKGGGQ